MVARLEAIEDQLDKAREEQKDFNKTLLSQINQIADLRQKVQYRPVFKAPASSHTDTSEAASQGSSKNLGSEGSLGVHA